MIPKIIHYCWLSNQKKPESVRKCLSSWKKFLPNYEFRCWNASSIEAINSKFATEAYNMQKWAFASDYIRLYALYNEGGIYLDSDVQVWDNLDSLLDNDFFTGLEMRDKEHTQIYLEAAVMGSVKGNAFVKKCLDFYDNRSFIKEDGELDQVPIPTIISPIMEEMYGWQRKDETQHVRGDVTVYSTDIIANTNCERKPSVKLYHLNNRSWIPLTSKEKMYRFMKSIGLDKIRGFMNG